MTRRHLLSSAATPLFAQGSGQPNLLYILVDQLSGLALPGLDPHTRMPRTAALMKQGMVFRNAYSAGLTCGPSRASLDTGLYTQTHGVGGGFRQLPAEAPTLPKALAAAGYVTSHPNGYSLEAERAEHEKWLAHLGYAQPASSIYGVDAMAKYADLPLKWKCGRSGLAPDHGFEAYCAQRAMQFLETHQAKPFACFLQLRGPHDPYMVPRPWDTLVDPASLPLPPYREGEFQNKPPRQRASFDTQGASRMTDAQLRQVLALYYGMCAYSDHCLGLVLDRLRELNLDSKTVVLLVSDHGDTMGCHRFMSKDFGFYEPAIRTPMVYRAPGLPAGVCDDPVSGIDVFPTLSALLGLPQPAGVHGQSLLGRWHKQESQPDRPIFTAQGTPGKNRAVMLRTRQFKYTRYDDGGNELYDLAKDPAELDNRFLSPAHQSIAQELKNQLDRWETAYPHRA